MEPKEIKSLLEKYRTGNCSKEERALLDAWYLEQLHKPANLSLDEIESAEAQIRADVFNRIEFTRQTKVRKLWMAGVAASVLITVFGLSLVFLKKEKTVRQTTISYVNDIAPGKHKAVLQLSNGNSIELNQTKEGVTFDGSGVAYHDGSKLIAPAATKDVSMITAITPNGGTYAFVLSDGTKVWLNAASSIKFPQRFDEKSVRRVELKGEAYFEVASIKTTDKDIERRVPFVVVTDRQEIEVLGTHFNVNSYQNELQTRTTLLEGSVRLNSVDKSGPQADGIILKPGHTAVLEGKRFTVLETDTEEAMAWKNGYFLFRNESLYSIMRKISRWYDVEVVYQGDFGHREFEGSVSRFKNVSEILRKFELTGNIHFKIEGRRIIVMP